MEKHMNDITLLFSSVRHRLFATMNRRRDDELTNWSDGAEKAGLHDRGAVSIEQVLWYAAAAVSVAVVSAIIWGQIKTTASTGVNTPSAP